MSYATSFFIIPPAGLRSGQTLVVPRRTGVAAADVSAITAHKIAVVGSIFSSPTDFTVANGASSTTITWLSSVTLPGGEEGIITLALAANDIDFIGEVDINGGTADSVAIGNSTPSTGTFTHVRSTSSGAILQRSVNGATADHTTQWLYGRVRWFGTLAAGDSGTSQVAGFTLHLNDAASIPTSLGGTACGLLVLYSAAGNSGTEESTRQALHTRMQVTGQMSTTGYTALVSHLAIAWATANQGGIAGWTPGNNPDTAFRGALFGGNDNAWLGAGSTYWRSLVGREINVSIKGDASVYSRIGLFIVEKESTRQAEGDDVAIGITRDTDGSSFKRGISFGLSWGEFPISAGGKLIEVKQREYPSANTIPTLSHGVDLEAGAFSTAAFASPGFRVDGDGDTRVKSVELGSGGPTWTSGTGSPEGVVTAPVGSLYSRTDGGAGTTLYVKQSGTGNTGWAAK